jgi:hypothetical protein
VPPPDQCFGTTDQKRLGIDDWLIVQFKLVQLNRATQLILKGVARARRHAHFWIKEAIPISSGRLVAAQSRQNVCFSKRRLESRCNFPQERIANGMTQGVIDVLEPVEIQQQHGELVAAPAMSRNRVLDSVHDRQAIWQACQNIVVGHKCDTLLGLFFSVTSSMTTMRCLATPWLSEATIRLVARMRVSPCGISIS